MSCEQLDARAYASLLRECGKSLDYRAGALLHQSIAASPLRRNRFLQNLVVRMYGECGRIEEALCAFDAIPRKNLFSWSIMIAAFARNGHGGAALDLYSRMRAAGLRADNVVFVSVLGALGSIEAGREIHAQIVAAGCQRETIVGTALVKMYGRLGSAQESLGVFERILRKDVVAWNSIIAALVHNEQLDRAVELYREMIERGEAEPDRITLATLLDGCSSLELGRFLHGETVRNGVFRDPAVGNALIRMYGRCRCVDRSRAAFQEIEERDLASWNSLIAANARNGFLAEAIEVLEAMVVAPDRISFATALEACSREAHLALGERIHALASSCGIDADILLENSLVAMYGRCGGVEQARKIFLAMRERDVVSWTAMIAASATNGRLDEGIALYLEMIQGGVLPDRVTFATILAACLRHRALDRGRMIHAHIESSLGAASLRSDNVLASHLVNMYRRCGSLEEAKAAFDRITRPDCSCWNAILAAYAQIGHARQALELFARMETVPDRSTFVILLSTCSSARDGRELHWRIGELDADPVLAASLIQMYGRFGCLDDASALFDRANNKDKVVWTSMIQAYARNHRPRRAIELYAAMGDDDRDAAAFASAMDACCELQDADLARKIHAEMEAAEILDDDTTNLLIAMYGKCGKLEDARSAFDRLSCTKNTKNTKDSSETVSWNAMIGAYAQNGHPGAGLELYQRMKERGVAADRATLVLALDAAGSSHSHDPAIDREILRDAAALGSPDERVATAVIRLHSRRARIERARRVFDAIPRRDEVCWSAMVGSFAQNARPGEAIELFSAMAAEGFGADATTMVSVLAACSHSGDLDAGCAFFASMQADLGVAPIAEHFACVIDLLARLGWIRQAEELSREMPFALDKASGMALLAGSSFTGDHTSATVESSTLDCAAPYVLLSNIYKQSSIL